MLHVLSHSFTRYTATLSFNDAKCENLTLKLNLKLGMTQINPANGAATGQYHDYGPKSKKGRMRDIVKWVPAAWTTWKTKFESDVEKFWSDAFDLQNKDLLFLIKHNGAVYAPNVKCKLNITITDGSSASNHHNIEVVRLAKTETFFGSHSRLYDSKDINEAPKAKDSAGKPIVQKAHVHEIGHLLGLGHVSIGSKHCPTGSNTNLKPCYGVTDFEKNSVMGSGMKVRKSNAKPWQDAMNHFSAAALHHKVSRAHRQKVDPFKLRCHVEPWPAAFTCQPPAKVATL